MEPTKVSKKLLNRLETFCRRYKVRIGIIAVPAEFAQDVCDILVQLGAEAIWNFAPVHLRAPEYVIIKNENLALALTALRVQRRQSQETRAICK